VTVLDDVCLISTWEVPCGIAAYTAGLRRALETGGATTSVLPIDRRLLGDMARKELASQFVEMGRLAAAHRVVHLQHEFGFFGGSYGHPESVANLRRFLRTARHGPERVVITFHSLPPVTSWPERTLGGVARAQFLAQLWRLSIPGLIDGRLTRGIAPSRYQRRLLVDSGIDATALSLVPQGAPDLQTSATSRSEARALLGIPADVTLVVLFGFVSAHKGHLVALEALRALPKSYHLVVLGGPHPHMNDGAYEKLLRARSRRPDLAARVHLTGWVGDPEVAEWFAASDVCVAPYTEPLLVTSAAAIWALASGRPLVLSSIPVFRELVAEWSCAEMVAPGAPHRLAEAIERVTNDEKRSKQLVDNAARACESWTWPKIAALHARVYG